MIETNAPPAASTDHLSRFMRRLPASFTTWAAWISLGAAVVTATTGILMYNQTPPPASPVTQSGGPATAVETRPGGGAGRFGLNADPRHPDNTLPPLSGTRVSQVPTTPPTVSAPTPLLRGFPPENPTQSPPEWTEGGGATGGIPVPPPLPRITSAEGVHRSVETGKGSKKRASAKPHRSDTVPVLSRPPL